jgi:nucleoside-diphosphate-sugar epimerase
MANYLVTGAAGFIGARTTEVLIQDGHTVVGIDNMNDAYDVRLKEFRLKKLQSMDGFTFHELLRTLAGRRERLRGRRR